eukprot:15337075-Alexandrium_andersonii.AAC.1
MGSICMLREATETKASGQLQDPELLRLGSASNAPKGESENHQGELPPKAAMLDEGQTGDD